MSHAPQRLISPSVIYQAACNLYAEAGRTGENCLKSHENYVIPGTNGQTYRDRDLDRAILTALEIAKRLSEALDIKP